MSVTRTIPIQSGRTVEIRCDREDAPFFDRLLSLGGRWQMRQDGKRVAPQLYFFEDKGKGRELARMMLGVPTDRGRQTLMIYADGDRLNLCRENLVLIERNTGKQIIVELPDGTKYRSLDPSELRLLAHWRALIAAQNGDGVLPEWAA